MDTMFCLKNNIIIENLVGTFMAEMTNGLSRLTIYLGGCECGGVCWVKSQGCQHNVHIKSRINKPFCVVTINKFLISK